MKKLSGFQKKYLKGLAHGMKPIAFIGQKGITDTVSQSIDDALNAHELIKIKFVDFKERQQKEEMTMAMKTRLGFEIIGMIGHIAILYRQHKDEEKRKITIPREKP